MVFAIPLLAISLAFAQAPSPPRAPDSALQCERLAGAERERCIAEEKAMRERLGRSEERPKKCDDLYGPEKEVCLKRGGTVKAGGAPSAQ